MSIFCLTPTSSKLVVSDSTEKQKQTELDLSRRSEGAEHRCAELQCVTERRCAQGLHCSLFDSPMRLEACAVFLPIVSQTVFANVIWPAGFAAQGNCLVRQWCVDTPPLSSSQSLHSPKGVQCVSHLDVQGKPPDHLSTFHSALLQRPAGAGRLYFSTGTSLLQMCVRSHFPVPTKHERG